MEGLFSGQPSPNWGKGRVSEKVHYGNFNRSGVSNFGYSVDQM